MILKAPFPWFGGKSRVADVVWRAFGNVPNYVEPFAGSLAVMLGRPHDAKIETVNDLDCYLSNFWRAVQADPDAVARWADGPVNETDMHARHRWLVDSTAFREAMRLDPEYYDVKRAGWWVWGLSAWLGHGWCRVFEDDASILGNMGMSPCGVFLDPPYDVDLRVKDIYACDIPGLATDVRAWALANGDNPKLRIALCGYEGEHDMPAAWAAYAWKAKGGYGNRHGGDANENARRERIWFSPHCLPLVDVQGGLFDLGGGVQ